MAKTGRPNFVYICQGSWRGATHDFQITGNTTGAALNATNAKTFMEGETSPYALSFGPFQTSGNVDVIGTRYYNGVDSAPVYEADYAAGTAPAPLEPTSAAFSEGAENDSYPLEICVMLEAKVGTSSTGKPVYCRKYLRGAPLASIGSDGEWAFTAAATTAAKAMGDGSWYSAITYCSPSGKTADSDGWSALVYPGNHQVPRGRKRKVSTAGSSSSSLLNSLLTAIAGGASATALEKIIAAAG